jgi:hypothetical protein
MDRSRLMAGTVAALLAVALIAFFKPWSSTEAVAEMNPLKKDRPSMTAFMRAKLAGSQDILDGLATEDFGKIEKGTLRLQAITVAEEWKVSDDEAWLDQSGEFRRVLGRLKSSAAEKNLDAATLNYLEMTVGCIRCHKEFRKAGGSAQKAPE